MSSPILRALKRLPDNIVLEVASREIDMESPEHCVLGWALRASIASATDRRIENVRRFDGRPLSEYRGVPAELMALYGGELEDWGAVFTGPEGAVEIAFIERLNRIKEVA